MGGFTISRVGHIGVQVTDMDRSIDFYTGISWPHTDGAMAQGRDRRHGVHALRRDAP